MEQWKTHPATGLQVSTEGRVITQVKGMHSGAVCNCYKRIKAGGKSWYVHRLVAETFLPNPENKTEVNHKNGNKTDNRVENLEWSTRSENLKHAFEAGLHNQLGEAHRSNKLSKESVLEIRQNAQGLSQEALGTKYGVSQKAISSIINRKTWRHI